MAEANIPYHTIFNQLAILRERYLRTFNEAAQWDAFARRAVVNHLLAAEDTSCGTTTRRSRR